VTVGCLSAGDGLESFRRLNKCQSSDGLPLNRLALARNGGGISNFVA